MKFIIYDLIDVMDGVAINCFRSIGRNDAKLADKVAVDCIRSGLNKLPISATIVAGEGERDKSPMLFCNEKLGLGGMEIDIAVDPLECTNACASGGHGAMSVMAISRSGGLLSVPDIYMEKIAIRASLDPDTVDLDYSVEKNLHRLAAAQGKRIGDLNIMVLDRDRHKNLIDNILKCGAKINLIQDGDIAAVIAANMDNYCIDMYVGVGAAPEGILAAAALSNINDSNMQWRFITYTDDQKNKLESFGLNTAKKYNVTDIVMQDAAFLAIGITDSLLLDGIKLVNNNFVLHKLLLYKGKITRMSTVMKQESIT